MKENPANNEENDQEGEGEISLKQWLQEKIAALREDLRAGKWPEGGDRLLHELGHLETSAKDLEMLSLIINDALEGIDVKRRYPAFYRRLLANPYLRQIFLDAMELLEKSEASELDPLPEPADVDLSFLAPEEEEEKAASERSPGERLRITLTRTREQLRELFAPPPAAVPMRSALPGMEDDYVTLLRSDVRTGQGEYEVILEGKRPADANALHLMVIVIPPEETAAALDLEATVRWGPYQKTKSLDRRGRATFPPLPLDAILDEHGDILAGLELRLIG